jgi:hypothetical protein
MKTPYLNIVLTGYVLCVERQRDISVFFRGKVIGEEKTSVTISVDRRLSSYYSKNIFLKGMVYYCTILKGAL